MSITQASGKVFWPCLWSGRDLYTPAGISIPREGTVNNRQQCNLIPNIPIQLPGKKNGAIEYLVEPSKALKIS